MLFGMGPFPFWAVCTSTAPDLRKTQAEETQTEDMRPRWITALSYFRYLPGRAREVVLDQEGADRDTVLALSSANSAGEGFSTEIGIARAGGRGGTVRTESSKGSVDEEEREDGDAD